MTAVIGVQLLIAVAALCAVLDRSQAASLRPKESGRSAAGRGSRYLITKDWKHEKPRLAPAVVSEPKPSLPRRSKAEGVLDSARDGCPECLVYGVGQVPNVSSFCDMNYDFGVEVLVKNKSRKDYTVQVIKVYKNERRSHVRIRPGQSMTLTLPISTTRMAINKQLARCACPALKPKAFYATFGHFSGADGSGLALKSAIRLSDKHRQRKLSRESLRSISKQSCDYSGSADMPLSQSPPLRSLSDVGRLVKVAHSNPKGPVPFMDPSSNEVSN